jgi:hypothetical protein
MSFEWKDVDDYEKGIETGVILPQWVEAVESAKIEIFDRLSKRKYPFDGRWLDWQPEKHWSPSKFPKIWCEV